MVDIPLFAGFIDTRWCRISSINSIYKKSIKLTARVRPGKNPMGLEDDALPFQGNFGLFLRGKLAVGKRLIFMRESTFRPPKPTEK